MIPAAKYSGKRVAVFGLGASGCAAVASLQAAGAELLAWDDSEDSRKKLAGEGMVLTDLNQADWGSLDALVLSPGVPLTHPEPHWTVKAAQTAGIPVMGDTEILVQALMDLGTDAKLVAITGTNGKSTTTALLGHVLRSAGRDIQVGGNIGTAVLELASPVAGQHYVIEFSSYQIDLTPSLKPDVGILLNLSPDHLDRHGDMTGYAAVKARMFALQDENDVAVVGVDDVHCQDIADRLNGPDVQCISVEHAVSHGVDVLFGHLHHWQGGSRISTTDLNGVEGLRGSHNWQNAAAAWATCSALGLAPEEIVAGFASFPGLAHRMEQVARSGPILFVNDSKATNAEAAARALASFSNIYWIAGGLAKDGGIESLSEFFPRIRKSYLVGQAATAFAETLHGRTEVAQCGTIDKAVAQAFADASDEGEEVVILFSPACASFDQFRNFEIRGDAFRAAVAALDGVSLKTREAA